MTGSRYTPMLATAWPEPFDDPGWSFEPKWDGIRAGLLWDGEHVTLIGRAGNDITVRYPELVGVPAFRPALLDGEIVALVDGAPSFEALQSRMNVTAARTAGRLAESSPVSYVAFDLLELEGTALTDRPLERRQDLLAELELGDPLAMSDRTVGGGRSLWDVVVQRGLEGVVAKRLGSAYRPGLRSADWRKVSNVRSVRAVVGGFTPGDGGRAATFGSLLLGVEQGGRLRYIGSVGTGFSDQALLTIRASLDQMLRESSPFAPGANLPDAAGWVEPVLVARIGYREWTSLGRLRHPRFEGFTDDDPGSVTWEAEGPGS